MAVVTQQVATNATSATQLSISLVNEIPYEHAVAVSFQNLDSSNGVWLGGNSAITASTAGYYLAPNQVYTVDLAASDQVWGIAVAGTPNIAVLAVEQ